MCLYTFSIQRALKGFYYYRYEFLRLGTLGDPGMLSWYQYSFGEPSLSYLPYQGKAPNIYVGLFMLKYSVFGEDLGPPYVDMLLAVLKLPLWCWWIKV